jgi:NADH dehydrogenase (ubiquinone) 1 beta subcomplex subunit 7
MGGHKFNPEAQPKDDQDLDAIKDLRYGIPLPLRDKCAHLLMPLNKCRRQTYFAPWKCTHERHTYDECEYILYSARVEAKKKLKEADKQAAAAEMQL